MLISLQNSLVPYNDQNTWLRKFNPMRGLFELLEKLKRNWKLFLLSSFIVETICQLHGSVKKNVHKFYKRRVRYGQLSFKFDI